MGLVRTEDSEERVTPSFKIPSKRLFLQDPYCSTSKKAAFLIFIPVNTSNPTLLSFFYRDELNSMGQVSTALAFANFPVP
jgi:hypothetical protein